jgi:hypothetical protein
MRHKKNFYCYVAGPYTVGDTIRNVANAVSAGNSLLAHNIIPFIPHFSFIWHLLHEHSYDQWLEYDFAWLDKCDALLRLPGESPGAEKEIQKAISKGLYVGYSIVAIVKERNRQEMN